MPKSTLIDSDILIDVWGPPAATTEWSSAALTAGSIEGPLLVNTIVWSEIAPAVADEASLVALSGGIGVERQPIPWSAAYLAGRAHNRYRHAGGQRMRTLPDFLIGAHALHGGHRLLTRDPGRYRSYFPDLDIIAPDTHPLDWFA